MTGPHLTIDAVIQFDDGDIVLLERSQGSCAGQWALPGGYVAEGETNQEALYRKMKSETGLDLEIIELLGVYDSPDRDPVRHTASVTYLCRPIGGELKEQSDAGRLKKTGDFMDYDLAFDHNQIVRDAFPEKAEPGYEITSSSVRSFAGRARG